MFVAKKVMDIKIGTHIFMFVDQLSENTLQLINQIL